MHGGCFALARAGLVTTHAFGSAPPPSGHNQAGLRDDIAISKDSIFLVASLTKPATCTAVVQLVEKGLLSLDTPVHSLLPQFVGGGREKVTVLHLLTHTSGLPDGIPENQEYRRRHATLVEFADRMCELDLLFEPGTAISYQSAGINLLGSIVHLVSGQPLPVYLRENVFRPLGMIDTTLGVASDRAKDREVAPPLPVLSSVLSVCESLSLSESVFCDTHTHTQVPCFLDPERNKVQAAAVLPTQQHSEQCIAIASPRWASWRRTLDCNILLMWLLLQLSLAAVLTSNDTRDAHCNWNSDYWRELGAPWGGLLTTASDYSHFVQSKHGCQLLCLSAC